MDMPVTGARQESGLYTLHSFIFRPIHCLPSDQPVSKYEEGETIYSSSSQFCKSFFILYIDPDSAFPKKFGSGPELRASECRILQKKNRLFFDFCMINNVYCLKKAIVFFA
jgi:hypothetical protein